MAHPCRQTAERFVHTLLAEAHAVGLDLGSQVIDHICFRTKTVGEYEDLKQSLLSGGISTLQAELVGEALVNGRPISTFRLKDPITLGEHTIEALELPAPRPDRSYESGFEHFEVVINQPFAEFMRNLSDLEFDQSGLKLAFNPEISLTLKSGKIKFHHFPLCGLIALEVLDEKGVLDLKSGLRDPLLPTLIGREYRLRPICEEDFEGLYAVARNPRIWEQHSEPERYKYDTFLSFFTKAARPPAALIIEKIESKEIVGSTRFYDYRPRERSIVAGYSFLDPNLWGGLANREIKTLVLDYAFCFVDTVWFQTSEGNRRSQRALEKIGAVRKPGVSEIPGIGPRVEYFMSRGTWTVLICGAR